MLFRSTGGTGAVGTATIKDDGTGNYYAATNTTGTSSVPGGVVLDDDRTLSVNSFSVNEGSPYAVFTVTGVAGQLATLSLANGTSTGLSGLQYYDASANGGSGGWVSYTSGTVALASNGTLLVRTSLTPEQETAIDNGETFTLTATNTGGTGAVGTATIKDDGTGNYYAANNTTGTSSVPGGVVLDDDRTLTVNSITVNEGSPYATFTVTGASGQLVKLDLSATTNASGNAILGTDTANAGSGVPMQYWNGSTWVDYQPNGYAAIPLGETTLLVRTAITNDAVYEGAETFKLIATNTGGTTNTVSGTNTGIATIKDDGTGDIFKYSGNNSGTPLLPDRKSTRLNSSH